MQKKKSRKIVLALFSRFPILRLSSVVCLAADRLPGDGVQFTPGLPLSQIHLALLFFRKLLLGDKFLHTVFLLIGFLKAV